jgi:hypothetical protein
VSRVNQLTGGGSNAPRGILSNKPVTVSHPEESKRPVPTLMEPIPEANVNIDESLENLELF